MNSTPNPGDVVTFNVWRHLNPPTATQVSAVSAWSYDTVDGVVVSKVIARHDGNRVPIVMINVIEFGSGKLIDVEDYLDRLTLVFSAEEVRHT